MHGNHCICRKFHWLGNLMFYFSDNLVYIVQFFRSNIALFYRNPGIKKCEPKFHMTHSEVRVTIQSDCRHKNLDTYRDILETQGRWHMNPHCQSFLGMYVTCSKTKGKSSKNQENHKKMTENGPICLTQISIVQVQNDVTTIFLF